MPYIVDVEARILKDLKKNYLEVLINLECGIGGKYKLDVEDAYQAVEDINNYAAQNLIGIDCRNTYLVDNVLTKFYSNHPELRVKKSTIFCLSLAVFNAHCNFENKDMYQIIGGLRANCVPNLIYVNEEVALECNETLTLDDQIENFRNKKDLCEVNLSDYEFLNVNEFLTVMDIINNINGYNNHDDILLLGNDDLVAQFSVGLNIPNIVIDDETSDELMQELSRIKNNLAL